MPDDLRALATYAANDCRVETPEEIADAVLAAVLPAHRRQVLDEAAQAIEAGDDQLIGVMDTPELGALVVAALNDRRARMSALAERANARRATAPHYPDTPEQVADQAATTEALAGGQAEAMRDGHEHDADCAHQLMQLADAKGERDCLTRLLAQAEAERDEARRELAATDVLRDRLGGLLTGVVNDLTTVVDALGDAGQEPTVPATPATCARCQIAADTPCICAWPCARPGCTATPDARAESAEAKWDRLNRELTEISLLAGKRADHLVLQGEALDKVIAERDRLAADLTSLGHPVTDEPALGPSYREQIETLTAELEQTRIDRDERLTLAESSRLARMLDEVRTELADRTAERHEAHALMVEARAERDRLADTLRRYQPVIEAARRYVAHLRRLESANALLNTEEMPLVHAVSALGDAGNPEAPSEA